MKRVGEWTGVTYDKIDDAGLHITVGGEAQVLDVDTVVLCTGQESVRGLYEELTANGDASHVHIVGGADVAAELDAKRAIKQATEVVAHLEPTDGLPAPRQLPLMMRLEEKLSAKMLS